MDGRSVIFIFIWCLPLFASMPPAPRFRLMNVAASIEQVGWLVGYKSNVTLLFTHTANIIKLQAQN